ncbi:MAG: hypothetical protein JO295_08215 [Verrucomicrobia bacterium]|nr:hypothetical protein [Verrucomicrobiota bacterium]
MLPRLLSLFLLVMTALFPSGALLTAAAPQADVASSSCCTRAAVSQQRTCPACPAAPATTTPTTNDCQPCCAVTPLVWLFLPEHAAFILRMASVRYFDGADFFSFRNEPPLLPPPKCA